MTTFTHWRFHIDQQNIGWLELDVAGSSVNILQREVMREWAEIMDNLIETKGLAGLCLLSGKERGFVYGADIAEFDDLKTEADVHELIELADTILSGIEALSCPTACGIDGVAVGGGLELALAFDRIVVTSSAETKVGFPEIHLGIMPGYGGTGRAMRRIKAEHVLDMVLSGRLLSGQEAKAIGLIDTVIDDVTALRKAVADELMQPSVPDLAQTDSDVQQAVGEAEVAILQRLRKEQTPAAFLICEHFRASGVDWRALVKSERTRFSEMLLGEASYHLRRVFLLNDMVRKSARGDSQIKAVHVIGAGTMGGDIAAIAAMSGFQTSLSDLDGEAVHQAVARAGKLFERRLKTEDKIKAALDRLIADPTGKGIAKADIVIEAVAERLDVKQSVFTAVEANAKSEAILATNTSSIMIEDIASALQAPKRLIGLHFFNPVTVLPLVEVIAGPLQPRLPSPGRCSLQGN